MTARVFDNIPEREVLRDGMARDDSWQDTFKHLAERAKETTWGLPEWDKAILGVCVMLEESLAREAKLSEVRNKLKGLQMENGRYKAKIKSLEAACKNFELAAKFDNAPPAESESA